MICTGCERDLPENEFHWKFKAKKIRKKRCKTCVSQYSNNHYQDNKEKVIRRTAARSKRIKYDSARRFAEHLASHPCVDCEEKDILVLQADHVSGKKKASISDLVRKGYSWKTISKELTKCQIRCANCHARKTAQEQGWRKLMWQRGNMV